jgi:hypothetical protein
MGMGFSAAAAAAAAANFFLGDKGLHVGRPPPGGLFGPLPFFFTNGLGPPLPHVLPGVPPQLLHHYRLEAESRLQQRTSSTAAPEESGQTSIDTK